jgi:oligoribonuclease NrnB/cAMP/cGMP phosphodiesterase (DHH superfamily)
MKEFCVIYHAQCSDGFGAAWAIWQALGEQASYHAALHGAEPPAEIDDRHVIIADFSYPRKVLDAIKLRAKSLLILDHHKSAYEDLCDFDGAHFDMNRSGAGMAWDHFHSAPRPPLIDYIEDRDLWNWKLPNSREILTAFECVKPSFENFTTFNHRLANAEGMREIIVQGTAILEYKNAKVRSLAEKAYMVDLSAICMLDDPTLQVPCVNTALFHSEVGNVLAQTHPLAIIWHRADDGTYRHSLRSAGKVDCSKIARHWGGGGHANAAGFTTQEPLPRILPKE